MIIMGFCFHAVRKIREIHSSFARICIAVRDYVTVKVGIVILFDYYLPNFMAKNLNLWVTKPYSKFDRRYIFMKRTRLKSLFAKINSNCVSSCVHRSHMVRYVRNGSFLGDSTLRPKLREIVSWKIIP